MRRITITILALSSSLLLVSAGGPAVALPLAPTHHVPCGTVVAQTWTIKVQEKIGVATHRGNRYEVWPGSSFPCPRAEELVPRMVRTGTAARLRAASFDGLACRVGQVRARILPAALGRVIAIRPMTARGSCWASVGTRGFFWKPAVPR
jgi:hypothetical protein